MCASNFSAWEQRLNQAPEDHLHDEVQNFLLMLRTAGTPIIDAHAVHFIYYDPRAHQVAVTGDYNDWGRTGIVMSLTPLRRTGIFYRTIQLDGPARLEYKLVVDGQMVDDPLCPNSCESGIGGRNSYFVIGDFREPPELNWMPTAPHGRVEEFDFESRILRNRRRIHIHLPAGYDSDVVRRFPSLYVHERLWLIRSSVDENTEPVTRMRPFWSRNSFPTWRGATACFRSARPVELWEPRWAD